MTIVWLFHSVSAIWAVPSDPEWEHCFSNNSANHPGDPLDWRDLHVLYKVSTLWNLKEHLGSLLLSRLLLIWENDLTFLHLRSEQCIIPFLAHSICRLEWKPLFWKSLSHTHSYSPITVESDFNNPLYEAGVSKTIKSILWFIMRLWTNLCRCFYPTWGVWTDYQGFMSYSSSRIHGSMKYPFKGDNVLVRFENQRKIEFFTKTNSLET